ncbi:MAG: CopD family protein [Bacteroidota bacterium]
MLYIKALHIIFVVTWFAGLFYLVRLFVYHSEANEKPEPEKSILTKHFQLAEKRLWYGITVPSAYGTILFGSWLLYEIYGSNIPAWMYLKIAFVAGLLIYHLICGRIVAQLKNGVVKYSSMQMRFWNEVATIFLISIVFIVILRDTFSWLKGLAGLIAFSLVLVGAIRLYKKMRK